MPPRILIIKPSALGDVATTLPLLCDVRAAIPGAQIDWLIHPAYVPVIQGHDALHEAIVFDRKNLGAWWYRPSATRRFTGLLRTLRDRRYDIVIDAQGLFRSGFLTRVTGAKMRIGLAHAREGAALTYTHKIRLPGKGKTMLAVERMRALGAPLGTDSKSSAQFRLPLQAAGVQTAGGLAPDSFVAVIPGARWNTKRWPIGRYAQVVEDLLDAGQNVVLIGAPGEKPLCDAIATQIENRKSKMGGGEHLLNLAGQTDIATMIALLARARLVVANDSGPLHIAAALGTRVVALYGPTSPRFVGPYGQMDAVLRHDVPCHPCRLRECDHHSCMNGLAVELVWQRVAAKLDKQTRRQGD